MSNGSHPAVLLSDLLRAEGPHRELADRFTAAECVGCGGDLGRLGRTEAEHWFCPVCRAHRQAPVS